MIKTMKPKNILITMIILMSIHTLIIFLRAGIFNAILNSAFLGFAIITLLSLKKKDKTKFGSLYLIGILALSIIVAIPKNIAIMIDNYKFFSSYILVDTILLLTQLFCLYKILIKNDYKYNKLFVTVYSCCILSNINPRMIAQFNIPTILYLLSGLFIVTYFYNYKRNYEGLYNEALLNKENEKIKNQQNNFKRLIKDWILYYFIFITILPHNIGIWFGLEELTTTTPYTLIIWIIIAIITINLLKKSQDKKEAIIIEQKIEIEKTEEEKAYIKNSKEIYKYYQKNNYDINDEETNTIISGTKNISVEELIKMYNYGYETILKEKEEALATKLKEAREKDEKEYQENKELAKLVGKDKYLSILNDRIEGLDAIQKLSNIMSKSYISGATQARNTRKSDPYILGGMAQGIAGPAAGLMIANQVERENAEREARGKEIAKASMEQAAEWSKRASTYTTPLLSLKRTKNKIEENLIINDIEKAKENLKIKSTRYNISETKNFRAGIELEIKETKILNKNATLDGSLRINILDEENNKIAEGYLCGNNIQVTDDNQVYVSFGFRKNATYGVCCKTLDYNKVDKNKKYKVEVEPINLWIMEEI